MEGADDEEMINILTESGQRLINTILNRVSLEEIKYLVEDGAPIWFQDEDEGLSPLHAATYVQRQDVVSFLLEAGAPWNAVDNFQNTAADIALSFNDGMVYDMIRDAGIREELLLSLLTSKSSSTQSPSTLVLKGTNVTASSSTEAFLSTPLRFVTDPHGQTMCVMAVKGEEVGVMMGWEEPIMRQTVHQLCHHHPNIHRGLKILNVGFGLGIIDSLFQALPTPPIQHVIIEPHRDVLLHMKKLGWSNKKNVKILEGRWQGFIGRSELSTLGGFDIVFTDTFSEDYHALYTFFRCLPGLLADDNSRFSFFNGLGATHSLFYDVFTHLSELHLNRVGLKVSWSDVDISEADASRWGSTRQYFTLPYYRLPVAVKK